MVQSNGPKKIKCAVFISGKGSNLKSLIKFSRKKNSSISIELIISDNSKAKGLKLGKIYKISHKVFNFNKKIIAEKKIISEINNKNIKLICLAGFMRILSKNFIKSFRGKILNIHPSLLPKYKGLKTHERAISNNEKYTGCTVHFVNYKLDSGKIILQKSVKISKRDTAKSLAKKVLKQEHKLYPKAIKRVMTKFLSVLMEKD